MRDWVVKTSCLQAERELPPKGDAVLCDPKIVKSALIAPYHGLPSRELLCHLLGVSDGGLRAMISKIHRGTSPHSNEKALWIMSATPRSR